MFCGMIRVYETRTREISFLPGDNHSLRQPSQTMYAVSGDVVNPSTEARAKTPAYKLWVDFGPELGIKPSSARITKLYPKAALVGRQVIGVTNLAAKNVAGFESQVLITGFNIDDDTVVLAQPERPVPDGVRLG